MIPVPRHTLLLVCAILFLFWPGILPLSAQVPVEPETKTLQDLWLDISIGPPIVPIYNDVARGDDMARVMHPSQISQLDGISNGRKLVIFKSIPETEQYLPGLAGEIDIIGYNLEHGPATPVDEQNDPVGSIQQIRALADTHNQLLAFGPDHDYALSTVYRSPPMSISLSCRSSANRPTMMSCGSLSDRVPQLRAANPNIQIAVQVRTEGDIPTLITLLNSLIDHLDGISILTSPDTVPVAQELVNILRGTPTAVTLTNTPSAQTPFPVPAQILIIAAWLLLILPAAVSTLVAINVPGNLQIPGNCDPIPDILLAFQSWVVEIRKISFRLLVIEKVGIN